MSSCSCRGMSDRSSFPGVLQAWIRRRVEQAGLPRPDTVHLVSSTKQQGVYDLLKNLHQLAGLAGDVWVVCSCTVDSLQQAYYPARCSIVMQISPLNIMVESLVPLMGKCLAQCSARQLHPDIMWPTEIAANFLLRLCVPYVGITQTCYRWELRTPARARSSMRCGVPPAGRRPRRI